MEGVSSVRVIWFLKNIKIFSFSLITLLINESCKNTTGDYAHSMVLNRCGIRGIKHLKIKHAVIGETIDTASHRPGVDYFPTPACRGRFQCFGCVLLKLIFVTQPVH